MRKLTLDDIVDMRAYERERDDFRRRIIELKRSRRVAIGPIMTVVFENTETMRWQVQEMSRAAATRVAPAAGRDRVSYRVRVFRRQRGARQAVG